MEKKTKSIDISSDLVSLSRTSPMVAMDITILEAMWIMLLRDFTYGEATVEKIGGEPKRFTVSYSVLLDDKLLLERLSTTNPLAKDLLDKLIKKQNGI